MRESFTSFHARDVDPSRLQDVLTSHLTYERLRYFRCRLVPRLGWLLLLMWMSTRELHVLPASALTITGVAVAAATTAAVFAEQRARSRAGQVLRGLPLERIASDDESL